MYKLTRMKLQVKKREKLLFIFIPARLFASNILCVHKCACDAIIDVYIHILDVAREMRIFFQGNNLFKVLS